MLGTLVMRNRVVGHDSHSKIFKRNPEQTLHIPNPTLWVVSAENLQLGISAMEKESLPSSKIVQSVNI